MKNKRNHKKSILNLPLGYENQGNQRTASGHKFLRPFKDTHFYLKTLILKRPKDSLRRLRIADFYFKLLILKWPKDSLRRLRITCFSRKLLILKRPKDSLRRLRITGFNLYK